MSPWYIISVDTQLHDRQQLQFGQWSKTPQKQHFFLRLDFVDYNSFSLFLDGLILYKYTHPHKYWHAQR